MTNNTLRLKQNKNFVYLLHSCLPNEIKIYNEALLKRRSPLTPFLSYQDKSDDEINILFQLQGELQGQIICTINFQDKSLDKNEIPRLRSLFTESMNILLGKLLSDLDSTTQLMSIISYPEVMQKDKKLNLLHNFIKNYEMTLATDYKLFTLKESYNCLIQILANKSKMNEA